MKKFRKSYTNEKWYTFAKKVRNRDNEKCVKCGRGYKEVKTLQVHHLSYISGLEPWEYALSECVTLCKGCHASEHDIIEPHKGWTLIQIDDLGGRDGTCERRGCGTAIRYEHLIYYPGWGYKIVGSSCIEYLTEADKWLSAKIVKLFKNISSFVKNSTWEEGYTKKNKKYFISTKYNRNIIRIYGEEKRFSFQIAVNIEYEWGYDWKDSISTNNKNLNQVKELAYIVLKGTITKEHSEKIILRDIYKKIRN